ncbi:methyltransferase [Turneriella parva DSM 21527]|uniref:Methyltransferase n=1 Tax=Turneriella parva (strain ATCC BAA-1111 / DSM 21527 / NCTC 11395 / H) TaxID=869212 RepID=I4B1G0_TURPD|nr:methyltransferase [Turneriella parva DSM 21527]
MTLPQAPRLPDLPELTTATRESWLQNSEAAIARLREPPFADLTDRLGRISALPESMKIHEGGVEFHGTYTTAESAAQARALAHELIPWRKGPFRLFDFDLDAEWRSDAKWNRLAPDLPNLSGKVVADVGCNNGYYLFRIAAEGARHVIGFDPTLKYWLQYQLLAAHARHLPATFLPLGWQALAGVQKAFDVIFLMGVNYHEADPLNLLHTCRSALKPGGLLICESVTVDADGDFEIFPAGKYTGIGGVYAIPTPRALQRQLQSAGFQNVTVQHTERMTAAEQRRSEFSPQKTLADFVTADGTSIEGYPPLHRSAVFAS